MQSGATPNFCPQCGTQSSTGARYCVSCGASFALPQAATAEVNSDSVRVVEPPRADAPAKQPSSWFATWGWVLWAAASLVIVMMTVGKGSQGFGYGFGVAVGFYGVSVAIAVVPVALVLLVNYLRKARWPAASYLWILFVTGSVIAGLAAIGNKVSEDTIKRLDGNRRSEMPMAAPPSIVSAQSLRNTPSN